MKTFEIYVHGTPRGHQIWGSEHNHDYISTFYNHDNRVHEKVILQIDICGGDAFYTYLRQQNIIDIEGRPNAFFALTVCFNKSYCTNVYKLFQLFEAVYAQICVGTLLKKTGNGETYLVSDFKMARTGSNATVDTIQAALTGKLTELIVPMVQPLSVEDTFNKTAKTISLLEVDSPLFFDLFRKQSLLVSPNFEPSTIAYEKVSSELKQVSAQKKVLTQSYDQLKEEASALSHQVNSLTQQLQVVSSDTEKKYQKEFNHLKTAVNTACEERDTFKRKIEEVYGMLEAMQKPFHKLNLLLGKPTIDQQKTKEAEPKKAIRKSPNNDQANANKDWLNTVLLALVLGCCLIILFFVLGYGKSNQSSITSLKNETPPTLSALVPLDTQVTNEEVSENPENTQNNFDLWDKCYLDIKGGGDILRLNKEYTLSVRGKKSKEFTNIPSGSWLVYVNSKDEPINNGDSFFLTESTGLNKGIQIEYIVNGKPVITRECRIQE